MTALEKVAIEYLGKLTEQLHDLKKELDDDAHDFRMEMRDLHKGTNNKIEEIGRKVESMNNELTAVKTKVELYQEAEIGATNRVMSNIKSYAKNGFILLLCAISIGAIAPELYKLLVNLLIKIRSLLK